VELRRLAGALHNLGSSLAYRGIVAEIEDVDAGGEDIRFQERADDVQCADGSKTLPFG
jgi:hypothetical protein